MKVYLDNCSTTPLDPRVFDSMLPYLKRDFGNPSSGHFKGWKAQEAIETAREQVASVIEAQPDDIIFTSGATEANNTILRNFDHGILTSPFEHSSISNVPVPKEFLPVDSSGKVADLESSIKSFKHTLISCVAVNNEIGAYQTISILHSIVKNEKGYKYFHSDITQALGKIRIESRWFDFASFSSHKIYGPKGVGAIYRKERLHPLLYGGAQEFGERAGTLNVPAIVGFGKACEILKKEWIDTRIHIDYLENCLLNNLPFEVKIALRDFAKAVGILPLIIPENVNIERFRLRLAENVACSGGSACSSMSGKPSRSMEAIGYSSEEAKRLLRVSIGKFNTKKEVVFAAKIIRQLIKEETI